jgi:hypothetical protein
VKNPRIKPFVNIFLNFLDKFLTAAQLEKEVVNSGINK